MTQNDIFVTFTKAQYKSLTLYWLEMAKFDMTKFEKARRQMGV